MRDKKIYRQYVPDRPTKVHYTNEYIDAVKLGNKLQVHTV